MLFFVPRLYLFILPIRPFYFLVAKNIINWLNNQPISDEICKSLVIRSNLRGETIAALFITEYYQFPGLPKLSEDFIGFHIYYSRPESPASTPDKLIYSEGQDWLEEEIKEIKLRYGLLSFFQVNVPVFIKALDDNDKKNKHAGF